MMPKGSRHLASWKRLSERMWEGGLEARPRAGPCLCPANTQTSIVELEYGDPLSSLSLYFTLEGARA